ncbi:GTPase domain-containing protein [Enterobacter sp. SA24]
MENIDNILKEAINKATTERGKISILIAGRSGVGKSTLINSVFQQKMAETGQGRPVTQNTREITKEGVPLTIFDTRGLEMSQFQETQSDLEKLIKERASDRDTNRHIHVAWLCIQEDGRRVEQAEVDLHNMLSQHMPVIAVITKARSDNGFKNEVQSLLPEVKNVIRVRAIEEEMDDGHIIKAMGLESLIETDLRGYS